MVGMIEERVGGLVIHRWPSPPPEPSSPALPQQCTPAQGLIALFALKGITEAQLDGAVGSIADTTMRYTAQIGLKRATTWQRDSATTRTMAALMDLSDADLDRLFAYAAEVQV